MKNFVLNRKRNIMTSQDLILPSSLEQDNF